MSLKEKCILLLIAIAVIVILACIPDNPKSKLALEHASPVKWKEIVHDESLLHSFKWLGISSFSGAKKDNFIINYINKNFKVELEPIFLDWNGFQKRRPLMLAGGDIPDVMWDGDPLGVRRNINNGFIMEVPYEVILKEAPTYVKQLNRFGKQAWLYSHHKGKNFGLPTFHSDPGTPRIGAWNMEYLRRVGITKVPDTLKEMEEALRRFRYNDPDQNGKKDTYGWYPDISHWSLSYIEVFCHYNLLPFEFCEKEGDITWGGIEPEAKKALEVLYRWYKDDLLDPDHILGASHGGQGRSKFVNGKTGYSYPVDGYSNYDSSLKGTLAHDTKLLINCEIAPSAPIKNIRGKRVGRTWGGAAHILQLGKHLENDPQKVLRFLHMMESIASNEEHYLRVSTGREGVDWKIGEDGYEVIGKAKEDANFRKKQMLSNGGPYSNIFFFPSSLNIRTVELKSKKKIIFDEKYTKSEWSIRNPIGKSDVVPSASRYLEDLRRFQTISYVNFITGITPLDQFDDFVKEWHERGGKVIIKEAREIYKQLQDIYQRVGAEL